MKLRPIQTLDRYLGLEFLKAFLFSLFGLVMILTTFLMLENLRIETKQDKIHIYLYILYTIPQLTAHIIPAALMFSVCFTVAQFTVSREMVAIHSAGVSFYRAVLPILIAGPVVSVTLFLFQNFVVTPANIAAADEMEIVRKGVGAEKDVIWQRNLRGREGYYFIYYFNKPVNKIVGGFNYLEMKGDKPSRMIQAKSAQYREGTRDWELKTVRIVEFQNTMEIESVEEHPELITSFPDDISFFFRPSLDPSELDIAGLLEEISRRETMGITAVPYRVQLHANIAFPLMCLIVVIVGAIGGNMGSLRSGGPLIRSLIISIFTMFVYQLIFRLGQSFGTSGLVPPSFAAWGPTGLFVGIAGVLVWKNRK